MILLSLPAITKSQTIASVFYVTYTVIVMVTVIVKVEGFGSVTLFVRGQSR